MTGVGGIIGYILGVPTGLVLVWLLARAITRTFWTERLPPLAIYGEWINLPPEAKAAGSLRSGGMEPSKAASAQLRNDIAHRNGTVTR